MSSEKTTWNLLLGAELLGIIVAAFVVQYTSHPYAEAYGVNATILSPVIGFVWVWFAAMLFWVLNWQQNWSEKAKGTTAVMRVTEALGMLPVIAVGAFIVHMISYTQFSQLFLGALLSAGAMIVCFLASFYGNRNVIRSENARSKFRKSWLLYLAPGLTNGVSFIGMLMAVFRLATFGNPVSSYDSGWMLTFVWLIIFTGWQLVTWFRQDFISQVPPFVYLVMLTVQIWQNPITTSLTVPVLLPTVFYLLAWLALIGRAATGTGGRLNENYITKEDKSDMAVLI